MTTPQKDPNVEFINSVLSTYYTQGVPPQFHTSLHERNRTLITTPSGIAVNYVSTGEYTFPELNHDNTSIKVHTYYDDPWFLPSPGVPLVISYKKEISGEVVHLPAYYSGITEKINDGGSYFLGLHFNLLPMKEVTQNGKEPTRRHDQKLPEQS